MKKLLLILGILALSSTNAFAANNPSRDGVMQDVETSSLTCFHLTKVDTIKISPVNPSTAPAGKSNITKLRNQRPSFVTAFAPPDRGSPPTRGEGGTAGGASR